MSTYSRHSVVLLTRVSPVVKSEICFQSLNTDIWWDFNFTINLIFRSLEVVCRGSETQLQMTENLN